MSYSLSVGNQPTLKSNIIVVDNSHNMGVIFFSGFGYASNMDSICKELNLRGKDICFSGHYYSTNPGGRYETIVSRLHNSDYSHLVAYKKDRAYTNERENEEFIEGYVFIQSDEEIGALENFGAMMTGTVVIPDQLIDGFYDKLYKLSPLPVIRDWSTFLMRRMYSYSMFYELNVVSQNQEKLYAYGFHVSVRQLQQLISGGLSSGSISISEGHNGVSETMRNIEGLDSYLAEFREVLARRIQNSFVPHFIPGQDEYSPMLEELVEYETYKGNLALYDAQKDVVQATCNALGKQKATFIIGEMGVGKTALSITAAFAHNADKKIMTNIVMCPGHLVEKWKKEIERLAPLSDAVIVENFDQLMALKQQIKSKVRNRHLWLVISKETAKFGYNERPAAIFSRAAGFKVGHPEGVFCCPECGKPLYSVHYEGRGRWRQPVYDYFTLDSFSSKKVENACCMNTVTKIDPETGKEIEVTCGAKLWEAAGKTEGESKWVNLGKSVGWMLREHIGQELNRLSSLQSLTKEESARMFTLAKVAEEGIPKYPTPIKYPLGKYIRRKFKGDIDYALIDECHQLKGRDSLQGQAFADLVSTARHALCFTGTFLNGYASGIFYLLYRLYPGLMKKEGFSFDGGGEQEFVRQYGVYRQSAWHEFQNGQQGNRQGQMSFKQLPGVSPIVFTKFLLENASFISLEDIGVGLPGYEEIPVPVRMDEELGLAYDRLERNTREAFSRFHGGMKILGQVVQMLSIYPDNPYDQPPIIHPETGRIIATPQELNKDTMRNKDIELVRIVDEKVKQGEKVLVYYSWANRTDLGKRIPKILKDAGISAVTMTSSVKNSDRERWIQEHVVDKNVDVLVVNPTLVETGLDLLDFTTIVYYEVGYNLYTMRQASRRSWRLSQTHDVQVYFLYYQQTVQEQALSLMATKLQAAMAIEGKFSEEGLNAMSNNEDILTQIAASVADGIKDTVNAQVFSNNRVQNTQIEKKEDTRLILESRDERVATAFSAYQATKKKSRKRRMNTKAIGLGEKQLLGNLSQLFAAV